MTQLGMIMLQESYALHIVKLLWRSYDEWQKNGSSAKRDDFMNLSEEEENRLSKLSIGCV